MKKLIFLLILFPICAFCQEPMEKHYKIYSTFSQKQMSIDEMVADSHEADILFFGEEHNDSTGHFLETALLKKLAEKYPGKLGLSMEMFETDRQTVLNEYLSGLISEKDFIADAHLWPNYKDYRPMIEFAKTQHIPVNAANAPARYVHMVTKDGLISLKKLDDAGKDYLPPMPIDTNPGTYYEKFLKIMGGHSAMGGMHLFQSQSLWDATMAWSLSKFHKKHKGYKILQINGGFHSEEQLGIVSHLAQYEPGLKTMNIAVYSDDSFDNPDWSKFAKMGDYIILTDPKLPRSF